MKKLVELIAIAFTLILICTCCVYKRDNNGKTPEFTEIIDFEYNGHEYIWFRNFNDCYEGFDGGIVHNPDCKCLKKGHYADSIR